MQAACCFQHSRRNCGRPRRPTLRQQHLCLPFRGLPVFRLRLRTSSAMGPVSPSTASRYSERKPKPADSCSASCSVLPASPCDNSIEGGQMPVSSTVSWQRRKTSTFVHHCEAFDELIPTPALKPTQKEPSPFMCLFGQNDGKSGDWPASLTETNWACSLTSSL
jgi:hypothetical protein